MINPGDGNEVGVGSTGVAVAGTDVGVGTIGVSVGGTDVGVGSIGVGVGGTDVSVGGIRIGVADTDVDVSGAAVANTGAEVGDGFGPQPLIIWVRKVKHSKKVILFIPILLVP